MRLCVHACVRAYVEKSLVDAASGQRKYLHEFHTMYISPVRLPKSVGALSTNVFSLMVALEEGHVRNQGRRL